MLILKKPQRFVSSNINDTDLSSDQIVTEVLGGIVDSAAEELSIDGSLTVVTGTDGELTKEFLGDMGRSNSTRSHNDIGRDRQNESSAPAILSIEESHDPLEEHTQSTKGRSRTRIKPRYRNSLNGHIEIGPDIKGEDANGYPKHPKVVIRDRANAKAFASKAMTTSSHNKFGLYIFTASQSSLYSLRSYFSSEKSPSGREAFLCQKSSAEIPSSLESLRKAGACIEFHWVPDHSGVIGNDRADRLASDALEAVRPIIPYHQVFSDERDFEMIPLGEIVRERVNREKEQEMKQIRRAEMLFPERFLPKSKFPEENITSNISSPTTDSTTTVRSTETSPVGQPKRNNGKQIISHLKNPLRKVTGSLRRRRTVKKE